MKDALTVAVWFAVLVAIGGALDYARTRRAARVEPRAPVPRWPVAIICGGCSGDTISPRKTFLTREGRCDECGSRSFMLASDRARRLPVVQATPAPVAYLLDERPRRLARKKA